MITKGHSIYNVGVGSGGGGGVPENLGDYFTGAIVAGGGEGPLNDYISVVYNNTVCELNRFQGEYIAIKPFPADVLTRSGDEPPFELYPGANVVITILDNYYAGDLNILAMDKDGNITGALFYIGSNTLVMHENYQIVVYGNCFEVKKIAGQSSGNIVNLFGEYYKYTTIDGNKWITENLRGTWGGYFTEGVDCVHNTTVTEFHPDGEWYYDITKIKEMPYLDKGGDRWRLAWREHFQDLVTYAGGEPTGVNKLRSKTGWFSLNGSDDYGFNLYPCGAVKDDMETVFDYDYNESHYGYLGFAEQYPDNFCFGQIGYSSSINYTTTLGPVKFFPIRVFA